MPLNPAFRGVRLARTLLLATLMLAGCRLVVSRQLSAGDLRGRLVVAESGLTSPVPGALVRVEGNRTTARSDTTGRFVLRGLPAGEYVLRIEADTDGDGTVETGLRLRHVSVESLGSGVTGARDLGDVVLGAVGGIDGSVKLGAEPALGAEVVLDGLRTTRAPDGTFTFDRLLPGDYTLSAAYGESGAFRVIRDVTIPVAARDRARADLVIAPSSTVVATGRATGRALLPGGVPATGGTVRFLVGGTEAGTTDIDVDGAFDSGPLPAGAYDVSARLDGFLEATVPGVLVGGDDVTLPDLLLAANSPTCGLDGAPATDTDSDGIGDACDTCPDEANATQRPPTLALSIDPTRALCTLPGTIAYTTTSLVLTRGRDAGLDAPRPAQGARVVAFRAEPPLPDGLVLDPDTGAISGAPTTLAVATDHVITADNFVGTSFTGLRVEVRDVAPSGLSYGDAPLTLTLGRALTPVAPASEGGAPTGFTVEPALPAGLVVDPVTGVLSGTPATLAPATTYTITATNTGGSTTAELVLSVVDVPPSGLSYPGVPLTFRRNVARTVVPTLSGGPPTNFRITPALPAGLALDPVTGVLGGTATALATSATWSVTASNSGGETSADVTLSVIDLAPVAPTYAGGPFAFTRTVEITPLLPTSQGGPVASWTVAPPLPAGLQLEASTGRVFGTPTVVTPSAGYTFTATNTGGSANVTVFITIVDVPPASLSYAPSGSQTWTLGTQITALVPVVSGGPVVSWSIAPALPTGVSIHPTTGVIQGTPTVVAAVRAYTVTATNSGGATTANLTARVNAPLPPTPSYAQSVVSFRRNAVASLPDLTPAPASHLATYSVLPAFPAGLTLSAANGDIGGTPTVANPATTYEVTVTSTGGTKKTGLNITLVDDPPTGALTIVGPSPATRGTLVTLRYTLADLESAATAAVKVSPSSDPNTCAASGVAIATGLIEGSNLAVSWNTLNFATGVWRACVVGTDDLGQSATFMASGSVTLLGRPGTLAITGGDGQTVAPGGSFSALTVRADNAGSPITSSPIAWTYTYEPGASQPAGQTTTNTSGLATFTNFPVLDHAGRLTVTGTATDLANTPAVTFTLFVGGDLVVDGQGGSTLLGTAITSCGGTGACNATNPYVSTGGTFRNVTLRNGAVLTGGAWAGAGPGPGNGVLSLNVVGTLSVDATSTITMDGRGYTGGVAGTQGATAAGGGATVTQNNGPSAGGAGTATDCLSGFSGGGGGGHATAGSDGDGPAPGLAGGPEGTDDLAQPSLGGGGGGGTSNQTLGSPADLAGGNGGGAIVITAALAQVDGTITADGRDGATAQVSCAGGGGGGAGGSIRLDTDDLQLGGASVLHARGGDGGGGTFAFDGPRRGGVGAAGRIRLVQRQAVPPTRNLHVAASPAARLDVPATLDLTFDGSDVRLVVPTGGLSALSVVESRVTLGAVTVAGSVSVQGSTSVLTLGGLLQVSSGVSVQSGRVRGLPYTGGIAGPGNGVIAANITGTLTLVSGAAIDATGLGYPGGAAGAQGSSDEGAGIPDPSANGSGGGAGTLADATCEQVVAAPGGGGGHRTKGWDGGVVASGGDGGLTSGDASLVPVTLGGGGGGAAVPGGAGGGAISIVATNANLAGDLIANGEDGFATESQCPMDGGSGAGAGGSIRLEVPGNFTFTGTASVSGGFGGGSGASRGGDGGHGWLLFTLRKPAIQAPTYTIAGDIKPVGRIDTSDDTTLALTTTGTIELVPRDAGRRYASLDLRGPDVHVVGSANVTGGLTVAGARNFAALGGLTVVGGDLSVTGGATLAGEGWRSGTLSPGNGVLSVNVTGLTTIDAASTVTMAGRGYPGGDAWTQGGGASGLGSPVVTTPNGQGGGSAAQGMCSEFGGGAGGGGGHDGDGGPGGGGGGDGGLSGGTPDLQVLSVGGGGGGAESSVGGAGGGAIVLRSGTWQVDGLIDVRGLDGESGDGELCESSDGGGGGAGGAAYLTCTTSMVVGTGSVNASGGNGGGGANFGGFGAPGRIRIECPNLDAARFQFSPQVGFCNGLSGDQACFGGDTSA